MKCLFIVSFIFLNFFVYGQVTTTVHWQVNNKPETGDTIYYSNERELKWSDFRGRPDNKSIAVAITASGFGFTFGIKSTNKAAVIDITVFCFFNKSNSWVKQGMQNDYALLHEQHHFDISYISACLFIKRLRKAKFTMDNYAELVEKINSESNEAMEKMQNDYDGDTANGRLKNVQAAWNKKIDEQLAAVATD
jgi:hypothetical protein